MAWLMICMWNTYYILRDSSSKRLFRHFLIENSYSYLLCKVEKILKGSLDLIPSPPPSVKIQIMGGKVCLRCKDKTLLGIENKKFVDITQQCFALLPQVNFPANNLNFHWRWRWWDRIKAIFLNLFYFTMNVY